MSTMKALMSEQAGGPDSLILREIPEPTPGPGEVRVIVKSCGINYPDALIIEDKYQFKPLRPFAPGLETAGIVDAIGTDVIHIKVGDHVIAHTSHGGLAEKLVTHERNCTRIPTDMPFDEAAGLLVTYSTSLHALQDRARLRAGETLLVLGAAGGVGLAAVELGKAMGAKVVAAVSSEEKAAVTRAHGADVTVVYPREITDNKSLAAQFKEACGKQGADVIYDAVGGDYAEAALRAIAWQGRFLVVGFPAGIPKIPLNLPLLKGCDICGVFWGAFAERDPAAHQRIMQSLLEHYRAGRIRPRISDRFSLPQGGEAIKKLLRREAIGKIVVTCTA
jgi:NADPH2:quinone reductase